MSQVWVEVEENPNCPYSPLQTFEGRGTERTADALLVQNVSGRAGPHVVVGWSSKDRGAPCPVRYVLVADSGAGVSLLVSGGDYGLRLRPAESSLEWSLDAADQFGEPYLLLDPATGATPVDSQATPEV
jgi:hypothetical protein